MKLFACFCIYSNQCIFWFIFFTLVLGEITFVLENVIMQLVSESHLPSQENKYFLDESDVIHAKAWRRRKREEREREREGKKERLDAIAYHVCSHYLH